MTVDDLLNLNIQGRLDSLEINIARFANQFDDYIKRKEATLSHLESFRLIEQRLNQRMEAIENFIRNLAELSYKGGFYSPDKKEEQKTIANLKKEIEDRNKRIAEFENTLKQLMGKK
jgi:DNA repair exonuclease SbcCD ATPase subunit